MVETRIAQEHHFVTSDNTSLFYRYWPALATGALRKVIVLFHRGHEHSGRLQHIVDELGMPEADFYAWDARGHGLSPGERGFSPSLARSVRDVDEFVRFAAVNSEADMLDVTVIATARWLSTKYARFLTCCTRSRRSHSITLRKIAGVRGRIAGGN